MRRLLRSFPLLLLLAWAPTSLWGQCPVTVQMHDSYGDGWNGNELNIYQGGSLLATLTVSSGSYAEATLILAADSVTLSWNQGSWATECSFLIVNDNGDTLYASPQGMDGYSGAFATFLNSCTGCQRLIGLHLISRTTSRIVVGWDADSAATWLVEYGPYGFAPGTGTPLTTTADSVVISNLSANSAYQVRVARLCGDDTSLYVEDAYHTLCDTTTGFCSCPVIVRMYDSYGDGWNGNYLTLHQEDSLIASLTIGSGNYAEDTLMLASDLTTLSWTMGNYSYECSFVLLNADGDTLYASPASMQGYTGAFASFVNTCSSCPSPQGLHWVSRTDSQMVITWNAVGSATCLVEYGPDGFTRGTGTWITTTSDTLFMGDLEPFSTYQVYVALLCGEDTSAWSSASFTTLPLDLPIFYVAPQSAGLANGTSWANATSDLNWAVQVAAARTANYGSPAQVWVAAGTYYGDTNATDAFTAAEGADVYGGFVGNEAADYDISLRDVAAHPTVLDGRNQRRVLYQPSQFTTRTTWDGFTLTRGHIPYAGSNTYGHGAYLRGGFTLSHCVVADNSTVYDGYYHYGGGIYTTNASTANPVIIQQCDLHGNGDLNGSNCYTSGAAIYTGSTTHILNCHLHHNQSRSGALYAGSNTYLTNSLVHHNQSAYNGAGVYVSSSGTTWIINTTVADNTIENTADYSGGGVYSASAYYLNMLNTVLWNNRASGTTDAQYHNLGGNYNMQRLHHCAIEGIEGDSILTLSTQNFGHDTTRNYPCFVNPEAGDYRLYATSHLINSGDSTLLPQLPTPLILDLAGEARFFGDTLDIGCYEYHGEPYCLMPVNVEVSNMTENSAWLTFASRDGSLPYGYEIDLTTDGNNWTPYRTTTQTSLFLSNLAPATTYTARVRMLCDNMGHASPYVATTFTTTMALTDCGTIQVADSTPSSASGNYLPTHTYYKYSYTQQLYTAEELGGAVRQIDTVSFQYFFSTPYSRTINLYLAHTTQSDLSSGYLPASTLQLVYSGTVEFNNQGPDYWLPIVLDTPFQYNGADNLVVAMIDNSGWYQNSSAKFYTHATPLVMAVYSYQDGGAYDINNPPSGYTTARRSNIQMGGACATTSTTCPRANVAVESVDAHSARVRLLAGANHELQMRSDDERDYSNLLLGTDSMLTGLAQNTSYQLRVRNICGAGDTSGWRTIRFTTLPDRSPIVYVKPQATGLADGSSWDNAMSDPNRAMSYATLRATTYGTPAAVWMATGTYYGDTSTTANNAFTLQAGVSLYGGFVGNEPEDYDLTQRDLETNPTILDGHSQRRVLYQTEDFTARTAVVVDGLTIQNGRLYATGAGAYLRAYTTLRNCRIIDNYAPSYAGGGLFAEGTSYTFYNNEGYSRTAYTPLIENCRIEGNRGGSGGGAYLSSATMVGCLVANNTAGGSGGGLYTYNAAPITATTIVANHADNYGGLYRSYGSSTLSNSIVWGNTSTNDNGTQVYSVSATYSAIQDVVSDTTCVVLSASNTLAFNSPRFLSPTAGSGYAYAGGDWRLTDSSICVNRGNSSLFSTFNASLSTDLAGQVRIQRDTLDMGCYESPYGVVALPVYADSIVYVTNGGAGLQDGTSWANAMPNLQDALDIASMRGYRVWVAEGLYYDDVVSQDLTTVPINAFVARSGVDVYGGFVGNEAPTYDLAQRDLEAHPTILDGQNRQRVLYQPSNFSVLTTWDGLVLQNGELSNASGAGAYLQGNMRLRNCTVQNNITHNASGAGIYRGGNSSTRLYIEYSLIRNNSTVSSGSGGGLYTNYTTVNNCRITGNSAGYGAGVSSSGTDYFYNTVIDHNNASVYPGYGAVYVSNATSIFEGCNIVNNISSYNVSITSCVGGVYHSSGSSSFNNSIIWGNKRGYYVSNLYGSISANYSAIEGGYEDGTGIIDLASSNDGNDPSAFYVRFIDPDNGDYHLHNTSPLIDAGSNDLASQATDYEGNPRVHGNAVDLGAFESSDSNNCPSVVDLHTTNVTSSSARLVWVGTEAVGYYVQYGLQGTNSYETLTTTDTTVTLNGLELNRVYTARVRTLCDSGAMSLFSIPVNFNTLCDTAQLDTLSDFTSMTPIDSSILYNSTVTLTWSALANATSYDVYIWRATTPEPATPTVSGLTTPMLVNYTLQGYMYGMVYNWKVVAWNECINKTSPTMTLRANDLPNLHVSQITNSSPVANQTMTVQWTVVNDGNGNTPPGTSWNDYVWITGHTGVGGGFLYGADEALLATVPNLQSLGAGESYTNSVQVTLPSDRIGNYFLFVLSDQYSANNIDFSPTGSTIAPIPYDPSVTGIPYPYLSSQTTSYPGNFIHSQMVESNESDNFFYKVVNILPPPTPDLVVTHIAHPTNTFSGNEITVQWTVTNQGDAATSGSWSDAVYIQSGVSTELDMSQALRLATYHYSAGVLVPSASYDASALVTIPIQYMGEYTLFVVTDMDNNLYESIYEGNNTAISSQTLNVTLTPPADLTVSSVIYPAQTDALGSYAIVYTVTNMGSSATHTGVWNDALYVSQQPQLDSTAIRLAYLGHEGVLAADSCYSAVAHVTLPPNAAGEWYLYVVTDVDNQVFEYTFEDNNTYRSDTTFLIRTPDLAVTAAWVETNRLSPGEEFALTYRVTNVGAGTLNGGNTTTQWRDAVYLTTTPTLTPNATQLQSVRHEMELQPDSSYSRTLNLTFPTSATGSRYLWVVADAQNSVFENGAEENNRLRCSDTLFAVLPDLAVTAVRVPDTVVAGGPFRVTWRVANVGQGAVMERSFSDRIYYDGVEVYEAALLNITLRPGDSIVRWATVQPPCGVANQGTVTVSTDVPSQIAESGSAGNNSLSATIGTLLAPDLLVAAPAQVGADSLWSGQMVTVQWVVSNVGNADIVGQPLVDRLYFNSHAATYAEADSVATILRTLTLAAGASDTLTARFRLPDGISGNYYLHVVTNATGSLCEGANAASNMAHSAVLPVNLSPWADLRVAAIQVPDTVNVGERILLPYSLTNVGTAPLAGQSLSNRIFYSPSATTYSPNNMLATHSAIVDLAVGDTVGLVAAVTVPATLSAGNYYLFVVADAANEVYEHTGENNNTAHSAAVYVKQYPLDLMVEDLQGNSSVEWGQQVHYSMVVKNNSTVPTLAPVWSDAVYLSPDAVLHNTDLRVHVAEHRAQLLPDSSYRVEMTLTIPMGTPSSAYLIAVADLDANNPDVNFSNNMWVKPLSVSSIPTADLSVSDLTLLTDTLVSGQSARATYRVTNVGAVPQGAATWTDKMFFSYNATWDNGDAEIGSQLRLHEPLAPGDYYEDTLTFTVPLPVEGQVYLIAKANAQGDVFEANRDNNTVAVAAAVALPLPGDLVVRDIDAADSVVSGQRLDIGWRVENVGENALSGNGLRSLVYLSADTVFDASDRMLGMAESNGIHLAQGEGVRQQLAARIAGVPEGRYFLLVKTNVRNAFNEVNTANNTGCSAFPVAVRIRTLEFNTPTRDTLENDQVSDFRLVVGPYRNETVRIHVASDDSLRGAVNRVYVSHNAVGDNLRYDFSTMGQYTGNPELYIPATIPQYYGISVYGSTPTGAPQSVVISADIIPFELLGVNPPTGGNTGRVTVELTGSRFRPDMEVWMASATDTLRPDTLMYDSYYRCYASFDLTDRDTGLYDVGVRNYCEGEAVLAGAFEVVSGVPENLGYNLIFPASPRPNRNIVMTLEFGNIGNVDITGAVVRVTSIGGSWVSLTPEGLNDHQTTVLVPLTIEGEPDGLLRPGRQSTIPIYGYTSGSLVLTVERTQ